jgi:hypothetical protein
MSTSATQVYEVGAVVLGYVGFTASWRRHAPGHGRPGQGQMLCINQASSTDEGAHEPAQSITITAREGLLALRYAIDEALKEGGAA